jgi:outer membrane lipoprotein carrier protein
MDSVKFWRRRRRPTTSLIAGPALLVMGLAWSQAEPGDSPGADLASDPGAVALLDAFAAEVGDLSASFEQRRYDEAGEPVEEPSTGRFNLLRADCSCFRWHYEPPDELIIVADGEWIWWYDVLIEQVDQRPATDLPASSAILLSDTGTLSDEYVVDELPPADGMRWIELTPRDASASEFVTARLGFADGVPVVVELLDSLGELTRLTFNDIEVNAGQSKDDFAFVPPRGVLVVGPDD